MSQYTIKIKAVVDAQNIQAQLQSIAKNFNLNLGGSTGATSISGINKFSTAVTGSMGNISKSTIQASQSTKTLNTNVQNLNQSFSKKTQASKQVTSSLRDMTNGQMSFTAQLKEAISKSITWAVAMGALYGTLRKLKEGVSFVYEFDNQMNNLRMITGYTNDEVQKLAQSYADLATRLSTNTMDVAKSAEVWLRQGRSIEDTNRLIETSMIFSKVGFVDSAEAANLLTSAINGYQMEAKDAINVVDMLSAIDVNAATSSQELARAMAQTASSAKIAGVSMQELTSYIAVVSETTRKSAESIGNSFKTIFARMQQVRLGSLFDEEGESIKSCALVGIIHKPTSEIFSDDSMLLCA